MRHIVFPQALKNIWPALGNEFVTIIKESSIISTIGVAELTYQTGIIQTQSYKGILPLFISMILYFILTFTLTKVLNYFENRMSYWFLIIQRFSWTKQTKLMLEYKKDYSGEIIYGLQ